MLDGVPLMAQMISMVTYYETEVKKDIPIMTKDVKWGVSYDTVNQNAGSPS
jgi:hypothetical protein